MVIQKSEHRCKQCAATFEAYEELANHFAGKHPWLFMDIVEWIDNTTPMEYNEL